MLYPPPAEAQLLALAVLNRAGPKQPTIPTEDVLASWQGRIEAWLHQERLQITRIHELLAQHGCAISYTSLRRYVARHGWGKGPATTVRMAEPPPGQVVECDFGRLGYLLDPESGRRRLVWALVVVRWHNRTNA